MLYSEDAHQEYMEHHYNSGRQCHHGSKRDAGVSASYDDIFA